MKTVLILFVSLIFTGLPLMVVQADESQARSEHVIAEQAATESTDIDSSADSSNVGEILFQGRCQMCHQLPEPGMLKPKQWKLILSVMQQRMQQAGIAPLTEEESERVFAYLAERAR